MWNYEQARFFMEQAGRRGSVLGLKNMYALMEVLGNPQESLRVVHIAGTNGKGSTGAYLDMIFRDAGLHTGRYSSPAVFDPLECWQENGKNISKEAYCQALAQVKAACDKLALEAEIYPTVFEMETALAFVYFAQKQVDVLLLETGLGGAEDATNVIKHPFVCVFTSISRDHMQFLGESLEEIAKAKAGIIKAGARIFSAEQKPQVCRVLDGCALEKIFYTSSDLTLLSQIPGKLEFRYRGKPYQSRLSGTYQLQNAALAIDVAEYVLKNITRNVTKIWGTKSNMLEGRTQSGRTVSDIIQSGIAAANWPGRFEIIGTQPLFILDGAHNEDAVKQLANSIENCFTNSPITLIIGMLRDKEHEKMLAYMMPFAGRVFTLTPPNSRALDGRSLAEEVRKWQSDVICCDTMEYAVEAAIAHAKKENSPILAFGSLSYLGQLKDCYHRINMGESRARDV